MDLKNIETIYPLSPVQEAILKGRVAPDSVAWCGQWSCTLRGELNVSAFESAWQKVVDRQPVLRTSFIWKRLDKAHQVVKKSLEVALARNDWRHLSAQQQAEQLTVLLRQDHHRGFDPAELPLIRLTLCQVHEHVYHFIWSFHCLVLDAWSIPIVLDEVFTLYEGLRAGRDIRLDPSHPYQDYITWLKRQDLAKAREFWQQTLQGVTTPTGLGMERTHLNGAYEEGADGCLEQRFSSVTTAALRLFAREHSFDLHTVLKGAWALLVSRYSDQEEVVFGITVPGRPTELAGVESTVGRFSHTLPVRVRVTTGESVLSWLNRLQKQTVNLRQYQHVSLAPIQDWADWLKESPLVGSTLVWNDPPIIPILLNGGTNLGIHNTCCLGEAHSPLVVRITPGPEFALQIAYDSQCYDAPAISRMVGHLETLIESIIADPSQQPTTLPLLTGSELRQLQDWSFAQGDLGLGELDYVESIG